MRRTLYEMLTLWELAELIFTITEIYLVYRLYISNLAARNNSKK